MTNPSDYFVRDAKLVTMHLNELIAKKCLISAHIGDEDSSFLTAIVNLDKKTNVLQLDCAPFDALNNRILAAGKVTFRTDIDGVKVSFLGKPIKKIKVGDHWVLSMPIPNTIYWLQRRKFYRVKIPLSHTGSYCRITFKLGKSHITEQFNLCDLSITGFSFLNPNPKRQAQLRRSSIFTECSIHLHNGGDAPVTFEIKHCTPVRINHSDTHDRIGCQLRDVSLDLEHCILRYMHEVEIIDKILREKGGG